jgi:outer membrane protein TolC
MFAVFDSLTRPIKTAVRSLFCLGALGFSLTCATANDLPFETAWAVLRSEHGSLRAAELERQRLERLERATRSLLLPQINLEGRYTHMNDAIRIDLDPLLGSIPGLTPGLPPLGVTVQDQEFWKINVSAVWPLYTGGRVSAARSAAALELKAADQRTRRTQHELHSDLVRRYFAVALSEQILAAYTVARDGAQQHWRHARRLEEEGLISAAERLHAEVAHAEADRVARHAARRLEISRTVLALFLNLDEAPLTTTALPDPQNEAVADTAFWRTRARRDHPILAELDASRRLAAEGIRAERGRLQPEVFAFGRRELVPSDLTLLEPEWAIGLGVNWALLDRTDRVNRLRAARLRERQVETLADQAARDLETLVESQLLEARQAAEQFATLERMLDLARENLRVRERAFAEGLGSSLEVVDARVGLARVETARALARYEFTVHYARLLETSGNVEPFARFLSEPSPHTPPP